MAEEFLQLVWTIIFTFPDQLWSIAAIVYRLINEAKMFTSRTPWEPPKLTDNYNSAAKPLRPHILAASEFLGSCLEVVLKKHITMFEGTCTTGTEPNRRTTYGQQNDGISIIVRIIHYHCNRGTIGSTVRRITSTSASELSSTPTR